MKGNPLSKENVAKALGRLRQQSNEQIKSVLQNARLHHVTDLIAACEAELSIRGSLNLDENGAKLHAASSEITADMGVVETIATAFLHRPPNDTERAIIGLIHDHPGLSYRALCDTIGKDVSLYIGHLTYDRFGFFRWIIEKQHPGVDMQSDIIVSRSYNDGVCYNLTSEAKEAFKMLKLI